MGLSQPPGKLFEVGAKFPTCHISLLNITGGYPGKTEDCTCCDICNDILQGIHWSTSSVLQHNVTQAHALGLSCATALPTLQDLDTIQVCLAAYYLMYTFASRVPPGALLYCAPRTNWRQCSPVQDLRTWMGTSPCTHPLHKHFKELLTMHELLT